MRPPAWRLEAEVQCVEVFDRTSIVALENVFDPAIPEPDAIGDLRGPAIVAERPRGALCACAFVGDRVAHRRLGLDGPQPFDPPETARAAIGGTIAALRSAFELEVGEIGYSYLDELVFWSVTPAFALEGFGALESDELVTALAEMLCR